MPRVGMRIDGVGDVAAQPAEQNAVWSNPVYGDPALFEIYLSMLDEVIDNPEIRAALDELRISPQTLRMQLITQARRVLAGAPAGIRGL